MEPPLLLILLTLLLTAFFSGMEFTFITANKFKIVIDNKNRFITGNILSYFIKHPAQFIASLQIGSTISLVIYGITIAQLLTSNLMMNIGGPTYIIIFLTILLSTIIILSVAEFFPRIISQINPHLILHTFAIPAYIFFILFYPFVFLVHNGFVILIQKIFRLPQLPTHTIFSTADLDTIIHEAQENSNNKDFSDELEMVRNAINFKNIKVRECMIPRINISAIDINSKIEDLQEKFTTTGYSKILVFANNIDKIIGYVHSYDMFNSPENIKSILRPIIIIPESMPANKILTRFIRQQRGVAVVVDENGGTAGMITIEDVIEEIFGEIDDEFDN